MATLSSPGLGSGIDVKSIVSQLVALEKAPLTQLRTQASAQQTKLSTFGSIKSQVAALEDAAARLSKTSAWDVFKASSAKSDSVGVSASAGASPGTYSVEVSKLAQGQSTVSNAVPTGTAMGAGTLSIQLGRWDGDAFNAGAKEPLTLTIKEGESSLAQIAAQINGAKVGVNATVVKDSTGERLLVQSSETGENNGFQITTTPAESGPPGSINLSRLAYSSTDADTDGMTQTQPAQNAEATINKVPISSASNRLADTLPGLSFDLQQVTTEPVRITVSTDQAALKKNVQSFVDAYNTLNTTLTTATRYDEGSKVAGPLQGDSTAVGLQTALRGMMRSVTAGGTLSRLSDAGIEIQGGGKLGINQTKLDGALEKLDDLKNLFTASTGEPTSQGFGLKVRDFARGLNQTDGIISNRNAALQASIKRNAQEQEKVNVKAARAEVRYLAQYNAMDAAVGRLSGLSSFVSQQITLWNKNTG